MMRLIEFIEHCANQFEDAALFYGHGTDNAGDEAIWLCCYSLGIAPDDIEQSWDRELSESDFNILTSVVEQRIQLRKPVAYLLGRAWFTGLEFIVNESVLIPRSPIAELIVKGFAPYLPSKSHYQLLDLCCGSGCIGLAAAHYLPDSQVDLADISADALRVATQNQQHRQLADRSTVIASDLFEQIKPQQQYDLIVSNPPYVDAEDLANMPEEFHHEPRLGLEAGDDGLRLVRLILAQAHEYLKEDGILMVEVGNSAEHVVRVYPNVPFVWVDFEFGGDGVFLLDATTLQQYQSVFDTAAKTI